jgi:hypothetical protein
MSEMNVWKMLVGHKMSNFSLQRLVEEFFASINI